MAYYPILNTGALNATQTGTVITTTGANSDILVVNDSETAVVVDLTSNNQSQAVLSLDKKSYAIVNNVTAGVLRLVGGTKHRTSAHTDARVYLAIAGTVDQPDVPTDHDDS